MLKHDRTFRSTMRGLRRCPSCSQYNGNRAKGCANEKCSLHYLKKGSDKKKSLIDSVQLISYNDTKIFSVRVKDRDPAQRNFVQIIDITLTADKDGSIVSRNAICFVDTCKYDSTDLNISCKHVKSASECTKQALELKIGREVLYGLNISENLKDSLWSQYSEHEHVIPAVQRINKSTFAVKCKASPNLAAGRLHVLVAADDESEFSYSCGCKKLRIVLSPNNSVTLENATCDHLMLILAGLLSSEILQKDYQNFTNSLSGLWISENLTFGSSLLQTEDFISFSENILNSCIEFTSPQHLTNETILDSDPTMQPSVENSMEDEEIQLVSVPSSSSTAELCDEFETANLELAECQIELMDQFKLTNQIDLCNDDIQLCEDDLFAENHIICNIDGPVQEDNEMNSEFCDNNNQCDVITRLSPDLRSGVEIGKPSKPTKRKRSVVTVNEIHSDCVVQPTLEFNSWLSFVIERINSTIDFNTTDPVVTHSFDVQHDFFMYLSTKFSMGEKRRIPNSTTLIKKGKHKGLVKSTWIFTTSSTIKRIFSNDKSFINFENDYMEKSPGLFVPYDVSTVAADDNSNKKLKRILPTIFKVFIHFGSKTKTSGGFAIEWTPNVFPKSRFGIMRLQFTLGFKKNSKMFEKFTTPLS